VSACATQTEGSPLGTAGSVRNAMDRARRTFPRRPGDALTDATCRDHEGHRSTDAFASTALNGSETRYDFRIVITPRKRHDPNGSSRSPVWVKVFSDDQTNI